MTPSTSATSNVATVVRRLHAAELETLRATVQEQHAEIERLRLDLYHAENAAESWRDDALRMMEEACSDGSRGPGLTMDGHLVTVPLDRAQCMAIEAEQANLAGEPSNLILE